MKVNEVNQAESQLLGFIHGRCGYSIESLIMAMNLSEEE